MYHTDDINLIIQTWETYEQYKTFKDITFPYVFSSVCKLFLEHVLLTYFSRIASACQNARWKEIPVDNDQPFIHVSMRVKFYSKILRTSCDS